MNNLYFAYGSNMKLEQMERRAIVKRYEPAVLFGYKLIFNKQAKRNPKEGYANIIRDTESNVEGILYELDDFTQLDRAEGVPIHYTKEFVDVVTNNGEVITAIIYIANSNKVIEGLLPTKEYVLKLLENHHLSDTYEEVLREQPVLMTDSEKQ